MNRYTYTHIGKESMGRGPALVAELSSGLLRREVLLEGFGEHWNNSVYAVDKPK